MKVALLPAATFWFAGCFVMTGADEVTVSFAAPDVTLPALLVTMHRYCQPL